MKIKIGDTVQIISGKQVGTNGKVQQVMPRQKRVVVEGVNLVKRHTKAVRRGQEGGIIEKAAPLHVSNVKVICPNCKLPTRVGYTGEGKDKKRICKKCHKTLN
jgi:large subunit ribosomal protein L24